MRDAEEVKSVLDGQGLMKMIHHLTLNGMEIIIVVHMMLYLLFCSKYGQQTQKKRKKKKYSNTPICIFLHCMMDFKNI
jgi:hypothetical protein